MTTHLPIRQIAATVCVAAQLTPEAMAEVASLGFKSVVNNRPDFEHGPDQPTNAAIAAAAQAAGLQYRFLPVAGNYQSPDDVAAFAELLKTLPPPMLMFCRSGARSNRLYELARAL